MQGLQGLTTPRPHHRTPATLALHLLKGTATLWWNGIQRRGTSVQVQVTHVMRVKVAWQEQSFSSWLEIV